ncbi:hypothetical protein Tco_0760800, partial [Tanacetum coccineum]
CDFLATHTALFRKFPEPFLCLVGISRYYELDENVYPVFLTDDDEGGCSLFASYPTKIRIGEKQIEEGQTSFMLLCCLPGASVIPTLAGVNDQGNQNDDIQDDGAHVGKRRGGCWRRISAFFHFPPKKLREGTSGVSTGGKSVVALQSLLERNTLVVEVGVTAVSTVPFVTSFVTLTLEREGGECTDSVTGPNLRTQHPAKRSLVPDPLIMTTVVATTVVADTSSVLVPKAGDEPVHARIFTDSTSIGTIYVPKWNAVNESALDDPDVCHGLVDQLAPPVLFSQLRVLCMWEVARQTCLSAEVRMQTKHILREKKKLEGRCARQADLVKEEDVEIANLKAPLSFLKDMLAERC